MDWEYSRYQYCCKGSIARQAHLVPAPKIFSPLSRIRSDNSRSRTEPNGERWLDVTLVATETAEQVAQAYEFVDGEIVTDERRRGLRVRQARPVKVYEAAGARYFGGQTEDISATGLRIELPASAHLRPGEVLNIHVGLSRGGLMLA